MSDGDTALDGNAAAGLLAEIFAFDITVAEAVCAGCGATGQIGSLRAYALEMGAVLRCPSCDSVVIRMSRLSGSSWLDLRGMSSLRVSTAG
jgi:uncharacterized protein DUF6510